MAKKSLVPRFGIGEWYGNLFHRLSPDARKQLANVALTHKNKTAPKCPFRRDGKNCTKKGGVCSMRLYSPLNDGADAELVPVDRGGDLRALCPYRFQQSNIIYSYIADMLTGSKDPSIVSEVRFLQRQKLEAATDNEEEAEEELEDEVEDEQQPKDDKEDVGNIDNVLLNPADHRYWCALELQAVYFSGVGMTSLFRHILTYEGKRLPFPDKTRRPDYRSSGPKRLMPQLQIKVPTLRRWGKRMAVVVDNAFYRSLGRMDTVGDMSNADIAWFTLSYDESSNPARVVVNPPKMQTLERAVEGLTGGDPVTLAAFEAKIDEKLKPKSKPQKKA